MSVHNGIFAAVTLAMAIVLTWHPTRVHPPGRLAPAEPFQTDVGRAGSFQLGDFKLEPVARYRVKARVLSRERYYFDAIASISPIDLALGWGEMSDSVWVDKLNMTQGGRFYNYNLKRRKDAGDLETIALKSSNNHLIPATPEVRRVLLSAHAGDVIEIEGLLVNLHKNGRHLMSTSLTRDDTGAGACEIIYVREARILNLRPIHSP